MEKRLVTLKLILYELEVVVQQGFGRMCGVIMDFLRLIFWIFIVLWFFWYLYVQFDRLDSVSFNDFKVDLIARFDKSKGFLRFFGVVIYAPYFAPLLSIGAWLLVVGVACVLMF